MKLNIGCGSRTIPQFINIDINFSPAVDLLSSVESLTAIPDRSCTLIYASHILEHFPRARTSAILALWRSKLRPGGVLRLSVPDIQQLVKIYVETGDILAIMGPLYGGQRDQYDFHFCGFDSDFLTKLLLSSGYVAVRPWDWRATEHCGVDDYSQAYYPHMRKDDGLIVSLNLEAVAP